MNYPDLPRSEFIAASNDHNILAAALGKCIDNDEYYHQAIIPGGPFSVRLFTREAHEDSIPLDEGDMGWYLAEELLRYLPEARFSPAVAPDEHAVRGWEIRKIVLKGSPAALALAKWY